MCGLVAEVGEQMAGSRWYTRVRWIWEVETSGRTSCTGDQDRLDMRGKLQRVVCRLDHCVSSSPVCTCSNADVL